MFHINFRKQSDEKKENNLLTLIITCRAKLLNADWLRQRAFFLNQEGTFGNQEGMITYADWLSTPALNWFPASNGV